MAKKRFLTVAAASVALVSVVGIGFSAWTFSNQRRADLTSSVFITHANTFGSFDNSDGTTTLRAKDIGGATVNSVALKLDEGGVTLVDKDNTETVSVTGIEGTWTVSQASYDDAKDESKKSTVEYSVIVYIKKATLGQYIKVESVKGTKPEDGKFQEYEENGSNSIFHPVAGAHEHRTDYDAYKMILTAEGTSSKVKVSENTTEKTVSVAYSIEASDIKFTWKAKSGDATKTMKPETFGEYTAMVAAISGGEIEANAVKAGTSYTYGSDAIIIELCAYNTKITKPIDNVTNDGQE